MNREGTQLAGRGRGAAEISHRRQIDAEDALPGMCERQPISVSLLN